jgi:hypothetical protein
VAAGLRSGNAITTEKIPRPGPEEGAFDEDLIMLENMLDAFRVINHNARWQRWDRDLKGLKVGLSFATAEPIQQFVPGL